MKENDILFSRGSFVTFRDGKKFRLYRRGLLFVLGLLVFGLLPVRAQLYHQLGASAYGGYSSMVSSADMVSPGRGFHTTAGFAYELQYGHLLFQTGVSFQWRSAGMNVADSAFYANNGELFNGLGDMPGTEPTQFRLQIRTTERTDYERVGEMQIPMLVGGIYGHFYFLGGFKLDFPLFGVTRTHAHFTTEGHVPTLVKPVTSMAFHGFVNDYPASIRGPRLNTLPVDLLASFEIGYNFSRTDDMVREGERTVREMRMRIAAYADYSIIPQHQNTSLEAIHIPAGFLYDVERYEPAHVLATDAAVNTYLANFNVGVKFTILFGNKQRFKCHNCDAGVDANPYSGIRRPDNKQTNTSHPTSTPASE
ncbi:MAG: hypothetical protein IJS13_08790 [Paludibacteraceae bacterium]|nr:hypothetical protein [Paludibacteraceae bacterium]